MQCIINGQSSVSEKTPKDDKINEIALFLIMSHLIRDHHTIYEISNQNIKDT